MRRIFIALLLFGIFIAACSKPDSLGNNNANQAPVSPTANTPLSTTANTTPTPAAGSGRPAASAIDDATTTTQVETKSPLPPPTGFVNDFARVIDEQAKKNLETTLRKLREDSKIEFVVVTVDTTGEQSPTDYAMAVARGWGVGSKDQNGGGIILLVAIKDRKWEIRWTRTLAADLENGIADELERAMTTPFRAGKYSEGITKGVEVVISRLSGRHGVPTGK